MFQSMTDGPIWEKEFALLVDQEHFEKVWGIMLPNVEQYADSFLTSISNFGNQGVTLTGNDDVLKFNTPW